MLLLAVPIILICLPVVTYYALFQIEYPDKGEKTAVIATVFILWIILVCNILYVGFILLTFT